MELQALVVDIMKELQEALREELAAQGHNLTGRLSDSIEFDVSSDGREAVGQMFFSDYGVFVNVGVTADKIPFGGRSGNGGKSAYIQGLIKFWENRGLSGREAVGAAFATAHVHKREGMPSRASYQYSSTGERTGFVRDAIADKLDAIASIIEQRVGASFMFDFKIGLSDKDSKIRFET
jgi:hypothetical protein